MHATLPDASSICTNAVSYSYSILTNATQLAGSPAGDHYCALFAAGVTKCWGNNTSGQLDDGTTTNSSKPLTVAGLSSIAVAIGFTHTCALLTGGSVKCWGSNAYGQLGDGTTTNSLTPVLVPGLTAIAIMAGYYHTCALLAGGECNAGEEIITDNWATARRRIIIRLQQFQVCRRRQ